MGWEGAESLYPRSRSACAPHLLGAQSFLNERGPASFHLGSEPPKHRIAGLFLSPLVIERLLCGGHYAG